MKRVLIFLIMSLLLTGCGVEGTYSIPDNNDESVPVTSPSGEEEEPLGDTPGEEPGEDVEPEPVEEPVSFDFLTSPADELVAALQFMASPIQGAEVTIYESNMPNAPRPYRNGYHEGLDYFGARGTAVLSVAPGTVIRADYDFVELTLAEYDEAIRISAEAEITPDDILDKLRGRQVWIEHEYGIVTRYAHLETVEPGLVVGDTIEAGRVVGTMGNSGTKSAVVGKVLSTASSPHLHFEIWQDDVFLGKDRTPSEVRTIYTGILDR
ncbi:MAG: M23 family metallopeptidase [Bacillota bacterium]|nr:M23 family metallopeptidase [Bacillota bacterium]MDW7684144.1 M23 family metallopeptidase [Bacillota bacterium]